MPANGSNTSSSGNRILIIGPLPPPVAGTSVSFRIFCELVSLHPEKVKIDVINSAPPELGQKKLLTFDHFTRAAGILWQFSARIRKSDQVLIFTNNQFLLSLVPLCLLIGKSFGKPVYLRSFGGNLDNFHKHLSPPARRFLQWILHRSDGLIVQTRLLQRYFRDIIGDKVHFVPGYRELDSVSDIEKGRAARGESTDSSLRLLYIGHIREEKGVFDVLAGLRCLDKHEQMSIQCDLFGPIYSEVEQRFAEELKQTPNARYRGVLEPGQVVPTLQQFDVLVFPSHYIGEGHPGVLIEAIMSGMPAIASNFRSIPEVIEHRVNGLLIPQEDPQALQAAIQLLNQDRTLLACMSHRCLAMRGQYSAAQQVPRILEPLGISLDSA